MQSALTYRTNRDLFSNYYLDEHLPQTEEWNEITDDKLRRVHSEIVRLLDDISADLHPYEQNESKLEDDFIRPIFQILGIPYVVEEKVHRNQRRPDYGFFESEEAISRAYEHRREGVDFYKYAIGVADAKRWGRPLDTQGEHRHDFRNPSHQIHVYLQETPVRWAVLTNGQKWRLYNATTSRKLDSFYQIDLPILLDSGDLEAFKYFYLFFRHEAFYEGTGGGSFLDDVYGESNVFAQELGADLNDNIYEAIKILSEGFIQYPENKLDEQNLDLIYNSSLIYIYRLIFILYAEAESRELLDTTNEIYSQTYSLNSLKQEVAEEIDSGNPKYREWQDYVQSRLDELFILIDQGSKSRGIPEEDLYIPAYNGGLFRTDPDEHDSEETRFLANHHVSDAHLALVIELLTRSRNGNGGGKIFVDYSSLNVRHLGSIYEGLLEYKLNIADKPLSLDDGEYVSADESDDIVVQEGKVYLTTGSSERKATGSYYTPEYIVEYIVENTLGPLVDEIRGSLVGQSAFAEGGFAKEFTEKVLDLKILDPAMGSGHFLTSAIDYLAREIIDAQEKQAAQQGIETVNENHDINWARRKVAQRCIYGVDKNPLAVELSKVSLWLRTLAAEQPLAFLDHHLKTGNSLIGSDIETVLDNGDPDNGTDEGQLTLQESFDRTRRQALEHVTDQFEDLLAIDNETLDDIKEMEAVYDEVRKDPLYQHLIAMANVHTAGQFGLDVPEDAYERMAEAMRDDSWADIEGQDWYRSAQAMADDQRFFHWELEFPIAFYEQNGDRRGDGGFDAIIGNPPWGAEMNEYEKDYFSDEYPDVADYESSQYFITQSIDVLKPRGWLGFIVQNTLALNVLADDFRKSILNHGSMSTIVDLSEQDVFSDPSVRSMITVFQRDNFDSKCQIFAPSGDRLDNTICKRKPSHEELLNSEEWTEYLRLDKQEVDLIGKIENNSICLSEITKVKQGYIPYRLTTLTKRFGEERAKKIKENREWHSDSKETEDHERRLQGSDVGRYELEWSGTWIKYGEWMSTYVEPCYFTNPRLLFREITSSLPYSLFVTATVDDYYHNPSIVCAVLDDLEYDLYCLLAICNSKLISYHFMKTAPKAQKGLFPKIIIDDVRNIPIRPISTNQREESSGLVEEEITKYEDYILGNRPEFELPSVKANQVWHDFLSELSNEMLDLTERRNSYNLDIIDYLGIPSDELPDSKAGQTLEQMQMPIAGVADTILAETEEEYEGLRIEDVSFEDDGGRQVLSVDISYKVDEDDPRETDRWDRLAESEFETYEAMAFVGLSDAEETLLREFVPVAVEEGGGFAGFRQSATKTNSPLDRLRALTLPDVDEVRGGLEQYVEVRDRADELEAKIEKTDQLIDEIVYDLYGLTDEEVEIVESAVQDD